ncbi:MAG: carboxypeptidase-like regulatory domain-containing protein, partial [Phycisphaeraceae bacterium]
DARSGEPMVGAQLSIVGTQRGSITARDGSYRIGTVPAGEREVRASFIGYRSITQAITMAPGATEVMNFELEPSVIDVDEIIVTGTVGEMSRGRAPFTIDRVSQADLQVTSSGSPAQMLSGKVAGASIVGGSGRPGAAPSVLLRGPTSINNDGRSQNPLYIVDGVILSSSIMDFDGMDIESIEVIKGAAAASLYGARAANGVIQITTQRGRNVADNSVRYTLRSEYGQSSLEGSANITTAHARAMNASGTMFLESDGVTECEFLTCSTVALAGQRAQQNLDGTTENANPWNTIQSNAYPGVTYDNVDRFFDPGAHLSNSISIAGRSGATNYHMSVNQLREDGVMEGHKGATRNNMRLNIDQSMRDDLTIGASITFMRNKFDESNGPVFQLTRMPAGVDLLAPDPTYPEFYILKPDPNNDNANPMNTANSGVNMTNRVR